MKNPLWSVKYFLYIVFFVFAIIIFVGCAKKKDFTERESLLAVQALQIVNSPLVSKIYANGIVQGIREVPVISQTEGSIEKVFFDEADKLNKGAVIIQVENEILQQELTRAEVVLERAKAAFDFSQERINNKKNPNLKEQLEADKIKADYYGALTQYNVAEQAYTNTNIVSPVSGFVVSKNPAINIGSVVSKGMVVGRISDRSQLKVVVTIADRILPWVSTTHTAKVSVSSFNLGPYNATIKNISSNVDVTTGGVNIELIWTANEETQKNLRTGLVAEVVIDVSQTQEEKYPIVPKSAIYEEDDKKFIFVLDSQQSKSVKKLLIQTGGEFVGRVEVIEGLSAYNTLPLVLISSIDLLSHGQIVEVDVIGNTETF